MDTEKVSVYADNTARVKARSTLLELCSAEDAGIRLSAAKALLDLEVYG